MELLVKSSVKFRSNLVAEEKIQGENYDEKLSGITRNGRLCWVANGPHIEVRSVASGSKVSGYNFQNTLRSLTLSITCVAEIDVPGVKTVVLAIGFETSAFDGVICLYSVQGSRPLQLISIDDGITSCAEVQVDHLSNILASFDGCLAVGMASGRLVLVNLNLRMFRANLFSCNQHILRHIEPTPCSVVAAESPALEMTLKQAEQERVFFGVEVMSGNDSSTIVSIMDVPTLVMLATGCVDGCLVLYNLQKLEAIHKAYPPKSDCPLMRLAFMEPTDDPRGHFYIWALHTRLPVAVMHSVTIEERIDNARVYKYFKSSRPCLTMPIYSEQLTPLESQTFTRQLTPEDPMSSVCMLTWASPEGGGKIVVFDLNQWYKEQMPDYSEWEKVSYLAIFPVSGECLRNVWLDENSVTAFNSIQRPEEHFYPNSLTFDCVCITESGSDRYHWPGLQNRALENFRMSGAKAILEPDQCYKEMLEAVLLPQFSDFQHTETSSITARRDLLLAIALEYNCVGILRECAKVWADGSHLGHQPFEGLSLSTLTEWIRQRFDAIRECCENLCEPLFNGRRSDTQSTKTLAQCTRQLKLLAELMEMIISFCREYIPCDVQDNLADQLKTQHVTADYYEVLLWLLNMGLLPVGVWPSSPRKDAAIPYPYPILKSFYDKQRKGFHSLIWKQRKYHSGDCSCSLLYIDTFIEKECGGSVLKSQWRKSGGTGLYPPTSLHAMLNIFRMTEIPAENKYTLFMYLLLDLDMTMKNEEKYIGTIGNLIKFPAVFKMNTSVIKTTQAFWKLDHGDLEGALEDLVSPLGQDKHLCQWQMELLIECLLIQDNLHLALRALQAPGPPIDPLLEMRCLLSNKMVCEAFQLQKSRGDPSLLREFFKMCWEMKIFGKILNLVLTEADGEILGEFLRSLDSNVARNIQFCYLLQRSKYMEALALVAEFQRKHSADNDTMCLVMDAYNSTMTPCVRDLSQMYFRQAKHHESADPVPLSSRLIKEKRRLEGGMYEKAAAATEDATLSWLFQSKSTNHLTSAPFLRKPIQEFLLKPESKMVYPRVIDGTQKRKMDRDSPVEEVESAKKKYRLDEPRHITNFAQKNRANEFESEIQKHISIIQESTFKIVPQTLKFFEVEAPEAAASPPRETDLQNTSFKSTSFLGATPRPSIRQVTPNRDSSMEEYFSPDNSRVEMRSFESPKARRSLRSVSPQEEEKQEVTEGEIEVEEDPLQMEDPVEKEEIVEASGSKPAAVEMSIPEIVVTCEDDDEDQKESDELEIAEVAELVSEEVSIEEELSDSGESGSEEEEEEEEEEEVVEPPPKRLLLNPAVKFAQNSQKVSEEESSGSEETEVESEEGEDEEEDEDEETGSESSSDEEGERAEQRYKFFLEDDDQLKKRDEPSDLEVSEEEQEERRIPVKKPLVSDEVIDILDSSEDEDRHFEDKVRHVPVTGDYQLQERIKESDVQSDDLYGNLEIGEESETSKDALNDALFESPSVSQGGEPMDLSEQDVHNEAALMTTVFSHGEAFEVRQVDTTQGALMDTVFSPADLEPIEEEPEEPSMEVLNTGALITTVLPNEVSGSIFPTDNPSIVEESTVGEMERGLMYEDDEDISFKSCKTEEKIESQEPESSTGVSEVDHMVVEEISEAPKEAEEMLSESSTSTQGAFKTPEKSVEIPIEAVSEREEVIEVIPPPKVAYLTTEESQERPVEVPVVASVVHVLSPIVEEGATPEDTPEVHEERQEVIEVIPPPKIAYLTTEESQKRPVEVPEVGVLHPITEKTPEVHEERQEVIEVIPPPQIAYQTTEEDPPVDKSPEIENPPSASQKIEEEVPVSVQTTDQEVPHASSSQQVEEVVTSSVKEFIEEPKDIQTPPETKEKEKELSEKQIAVSENLEIEVTGKGRKNKGKAESTKGTKGRKRSSSTEESQVTEPRRITRAASVPKMTTILEETPKKSMTPARVMTRRRSSVLLEIESPATPRTTRARSRGLEDVAENVDTGRAPSKRRAESEEPQTVVPVKKTRSRRGSTASETPEASTPSKNLRSRKKSMDEEETVSQSDNVTKRRNVRGSSKPPTEPDIQEESEELQVYSQTRRLTRSQMAVLEKVKARPEPAPKRPRGGKKTPVPEEDGGSDHESVQSEKSTPESVKSVKSRGSRVSKTSRGKRAVSVESTKSSASTKSRGKNASKEPTDDASGRSLRKRK